MSSCFLTTASGPQMGRGGVPITSLWPIEEVFMTAVAMLAKNVLPYVVAAKVTN